jgi:hypothetical protein
MNLILKKEEQVKKNRGIKVFMVFFLHSDEVSLIMCSNDEKTFTISNHNSFQLNYSAYLAGMLVLLLKINFEFVSLPIKCMHKLASMLLQL